MRQRGWIAVGVLVGALALAACAGPSDEERCKRAGGVWKSKSCEMQTK